MQFPRDMANPLSHLGGMARAWRVSAATRRQAYAEGIGDGFFQQMVEFGSVHDVSPGLPGVGSPVRVGEETSGLALSCANPFIYPRSPQGRRNVFPAEIIA